MKDGRWQAKDIDDRLFLRCVEWASYEAHPPGTSLAEPFATPHWVFTWTLERMLPMFPPPVVLAKASALIRRGLLRGCDCGCRGDFEITDAGFAFLGA